MKQNLGWALAYNGRGILLAAFGLLSPVGEASAIAYRVWSWWATRFACGKIDSTTGRKLNQWSAASDARSLESTGL